MKLQLIFYCALVFYLELVASIPYEFETQRYPEVQNTRPAYKRYYPPNLPLPHQGFNQNTYNAGANNNQPRQSQELPRINTLNQFANYKQEYVPNVPQQVHQEPSKEYQNRVRLPFNNANAPIYRQWRNVNLPPFQNKPIQHTPETTLSVTDFKNNHRFESYNLPQTSHVAPVPHFGNPNNVKENPYVESDTKEKNQLIKHQALMQDNGYINKVSANTFGQLFLPPIPSVPPKNRDPRAKPKNMLINRYVQPIEIKAENKDPMPILANFADRLLARAGNPDEQLTKTVKMPSHNVHNLLSDSNIDRVLYSTKHKKRYLVIHPNGTIEHVDTLETVSQRHPNYVLVHAGDIIPKPTSKVERVPDSPVSPQTIKFPQKAVVNHTNAQNVSVATKHIVKDQKVEITVAPVHKEISNEKSSPHSYVQRAPIGNPPTVQSPNNNKNVTLNVIIQNEVIARPTIKEVNDSKTTSISIGKRAPTFEIVSKITPLSDVRETRIAVPSTVQVANETKPFENDEKAPNVSIAEFVVAKTTPKQANTTTKGEIQVKKNVTNHVFQNTQNNNTKNTVSTKAIAEIVPVKEETVNKTKAISLSKVKSTPVPIVLTTGKEKEVVVIKANTKGEQSNTETNITNAANVPTENKQLFNKAEAISLSKVEAVVVPVPIGTEIKPAITKANAVIVQPTMKTTTINSSMVSPENKQIIAAKAISSSNVESVSAPIVLPPSTEKEPATTKADIFSAQPNTKLTIVYGADTQPESKQIVNNTTATSSSQVEFVPIPIVLPSGTEEEPATTKVNTVNVQPNTKFTIIYGANIPHDGSLTTAAASSSVQDVPSKSSTNNVTAQAATQIPLTLPPKVSNATAEVNSTLPKTAQSPTANNEVPTNTSNAEKPKVLSVIPETHHSNPVTSNSTKPMSTSGSIPAKQYPKIPGDLDISKVKSQEKPAIWFKTTDPNFWDKITDGNETYDVVYFFQIHNQPKVDNDTKKTIYPNGTIVEEITKSVWEDGQDTPKITRTTIITHPEDIK